MELGATYKDQITGFAGIAVGHCRYITGCNQTLIVPKVKKDGTHADGVWFDDQRLKRTRGAVIQINNGATPGPDKAPARNH